MCGRYALRTSVPELARLLGAEPPAELAPRYNIAPTQPVPVLRVRDGRREVRLLRWGLVPSWSQGPDPRYAMHNARLEGLASKPAYRGPIRRRRCLVPADGWYEWQAAGTGKQPWLIHRRDGAPFCFAGLWERWERGADTLDSCTIITAPAIPALAHLHARMPALAAPETWDAWLDPALTDTGAALALLQPAYAPQVSCTAVSTHVNNARNDDPLCAQPLA